MKKGIAFDLEGNILNMEDLHFQAFVLASKEVGLDLTFKSIVEKIPNAIGGGDQLVCQGIYNLSNKRMSVSKILECKNYYYGSMLEKLNGIELRPGFKDIYNQIKRMDIGVAIGSLTSVKYAEILLSRSGLDRLFPPENVVLAENVQKLKPAPDVYLETARRMGIQPNEQLVFEDSATGLIAARAAGSLAIAMPVYHFPENLIMIIQAGAFRIFWDWREINIKALIINLNEK